MQTIIHHSIADLYHTLGLPMDSETEFSIFSVPDIHPQIPFKSPILRANYFSFILTINGSGTYFLDDNKFPFHSKSFYFTNPGHIKSYQLDESKEAYIITLSERFLQDHVHHEIFGEFPFLLAEKVAPKNLNSKILREFDFLYKQIMTEFNHNSIYKNKILGNLCMILLLKIKENFWADYDPIDEGNRDSQIVKSFKRLLEKEFKIILENQHREARIQAQHLAEKMNLHPNYLNSVIKNKTGRTINDWIGKRTISLAKSLLISSTISTKELAFKFGFSEPTHFSRFFKKHTQSSPTQFRKVRRLERNL